MTPPAAPRAPADRSGPSPAPRRRALAVLRFGSPRRWWHTLRWLLGVVAAVRRRRGETRLTVAVDVNSLYEPLTGVGWYAYQLLTHLADADDLRLRLYGQSLVEGDPGAPAPVVPLPRGQAIEWVTYDAPDGLVVPPWRGRQLLRRLAPLLAAADANRVLFAPNFLVPPLFRYASGAQVAMVHDLTLERLPAAARPDTAVALGERLEETLHAAALLLTPSAAVRDELVARGVAPQRVRAIHHGPGQLATLDAGEPPPGVPPRYGLYVGTLEPRKNLPVLLAAWQELRRRMPGAPPLLLCGRWGWQTGSLAAEVRQGIAEGWLLHLGYVTPESLAALYRHAALVALPSLYEGFGLPLVEALAAGVPPVVSDLPVLREVGGDAALFVPPDDPLAWTAALARVLGDEALRAELAERGCARAAASTGAARRRLRRRPGARRRLGRGAGRKLYCQPGMRPIRDLPPPPSSPRAATVPPPEPRAVTRPSSVPSLAQRGTPRLAVDLRAALGEVTGIGVYTRALLTALARRGSFELLAVAHRSPRHGGWLREAGIAFEAQPAPYGVLWQQLRLPRRLARGDVDLFWSPLQTLPLLGSVPAVVTVHDLTTLLLPETHRLKVKLTQVPFLARSLARARRIVVDSEATAADVRHFFPEATDRLRVVWAGVEPRFAPASPEQVAATRQRLGCPQGYVLYAGTLEPRKNVALLLDAWLALRAEGADPPPLLLAGGYGWKSRDLLQRLEREAGAGVRLLGRLGDEEHLSVLQAARCFVYPSLYEGFGLPAVEALACGVPTVVAHTSSLPEVVGEAAWLVDAHDPGELADALRRLLDEPARAAELAARGPRQAARFSWETSAAQLEAVLLEALVA